KGFGPDGEAQVWLGDDSRATAVGIDPAGRILAGGDSTTGGSRRWVVGRLGRTGKPDSSFGTAGAGSAPESGASGGGPALPVGPDSSSLLLVNEGARDLVVNLDSDGSRDRWFGHDGQTPVPVPGAAALAWLPDASSVVAGDGLACVFVGPLGRIDRTTSGAIP